MGNREAPLGGLPKNFVRGCTLLLLGEQPSYGYDLLEGLAHLGFERTDRGGLYRSLRAMEQEGLVRSAIAASDLGPERRIYELTPDGEAWLHAWAQALKEMQWSLRKCLRRYEALFKEAARRAVELEPAAQVAHPSSSSAQVPSSSLYGAIGSVSPIALLGRGWSAVGSANKASTKPAGRTS